MTPQANHSAPTPDPPKQKQVAENDFDEFVTFFNHICSYKSYQNLKDAARDHIKLREELNETTIAYHRNIKELNRLTEVRKADKESLDKAVADNEATARKLKDEQKNVTDLKNRISSLEKDVKRSIDDSKKHQTHAASLVNIVAGLDKQLDLAKEENGSLANKLQSTQEQLRTRSEAFAAAEGNLAVFQSFTAKLTPLETVRANISGRLGSFFDEALDLFRDFLCIDLEERWLNDSGSWERIRGHVSIERTIPLPASNSAHAKRMRAVAGLVIYAKALNQHVFRQIYLPAGDGVEKALDTLQKVNPDQDKFVRAVLLKVLPDQQRAYQQACGERVAEEILMVLDIWVLDDQRAQFRSRLSQLTSALCDNWQHVRRLDKRVEPRFTFEVPSDWRPLPTPTNPPPPGHDGMTVKSQSQGSRGRQLRQQYAEPLALSTRDIVKVVWPAFFAVSLEQLTEEEDDPLELIHHGYVLAYADAQGAAEEMSRRSIRRATRESDAIGQKKRRDSAGNFLSKGASDGSKVT